MAKSRSQRNVSQKALSAKIEKIYHEERKKPPGERRSRKAILGKAYGILRGGKR